MTAAHVAARLHARPTGPGRWIARCPAHDDRSPSLSIREGREGRVVIHCFGGCASAAVLAAAGISWRDMLGAPPTAEQRRAAAERRRAEERRWLRALARAVIVIGRRHPGHAGLARLRDEVARDLRARGGAE
ncbi:MAG TPA: hypothetical protein VE996_04530 [Terriglobales bacterium]|nr:hypothetical protein [Terriglobales bacterium]